MRFGFRFFALYVFPVVTKIRNAIKKSRVHLHDREDKIATTNVPGPLDIRHAQFMAKYEEYKKRNPDFTETQISELYYIFFNHFSDVSREYLRKAFFL